MVVLGNVGKIWWPSSTGGPDRPALTYSKSPPKDKKINFIKGNSPCTNKCGNSKWTLYQTVEESSSGGEHNDDQYNYGNLNPSGSEHNEGVSDILNRMAVVTPRTMLFFNDEQSGKSVVKSGTSTICINETQVESMGLDITQIKPRTVNIADKDSIFVDNYRRFEAKIGDPPNEKIAMCMLPLGSVDPVLDLR